MIKEGEELWKKYCSFFDKPFSEQVEYNELKLKEYFKRWKQTKMAKQPRYKKVKKLEDIPLTDYSDYPILNEFGAKMQKLSEIVARRNGESLWDYYIRIGEKASPMLDGWIMDKYAFCMKTSGHSGKSKWIAHGNTCLKNMFADAMAATVLICSEYRGSTNIRKGDKIIQLSAPPPYASGYMLEAWSSIFKCVPPPRITENIASMGKKIQMIFKLIQKGGDFAFMSVVPSVCCLMADYLTNRGKFFQDQYQSASFGMKKSVLFLMYLKAKLRNSGYQKAKEILHVKGVATGGVDARLYLDKLRYHFEVEPLNIYGSSESGFSMIGIPEKKTSLVPFLRSSYLEFLTENNEMKKVDELKRGRVYEIVVTPFGSSLIRYRMDDLFRVMDFMDDGMPIFNFEGRRQEAIDIYNYYRISTSVVLNALKEAGLKATDNWVVVKILDPKEHLLFLMEKEWEFSEEKATRIIFNSLQKVFEDFRKYVKDFEIHDPSEALRVEYLKKGVFARYIAKKAKEGAPLGQLKLPKLIKDETSRNVMLLREVL